MDRCDRIEDLLAQSDVVSLHCPLTPQSHKMINAERLAQMQPHALLINTARGAIIDIEALLDALRNGTIAGAGIDVLPAEPPAPEDAIALAYANGKDPIVGERLFLTPHAAWSSPESVAGMAPGRLFGRTKPCSSLARTGNQLAQPGPKRPVQKDRLSVGTKRHKRPKSRLRQ